MDELAEQLLVLLREAEHPADDVDRDVLRVLDRSVDHGLAGSDLTHLVEQLVGTSRRISGSHGSIIFGANAGRSRRRAMSWNGGSLRDRRRAADRGGQRTVAGPTDADHDRPAREVLGVVGDLVDGVVGQRHPHAAVAIGVSDGATALAQLLPHLGCVGVVGRIGVVEVGARSRRPGRSRRRRTAPAARRRCPRGCSR